MTPIACLLEPAAIPLALEQAYAAAGLELLRFPIADMDVPASPAAFAGFLGDVRGRMTAGEHVYLHCLAGRGRTGMALACLLVLGGEPAVTAVSAARACYRREAVETPEQRRFVEEFAATVRA